MLRLAHISDTHLGNRQYGSDIRKQDYLDAFEEAIDRSIELDVNAVIHTGDLFDDPSPDIETLDETIRVLEKLETADIPFYGIVGNHERKRAGQWMDVIERLGNTHRLSTDPTYISDEDETVVLYGFDAIRRPQWNSTDFTVTPPDKEYEDVPHLVCFHELFTPPLQEITADYELQPVLEELNITPELVLLGDNHTPEEATIEIDGETITTYYPGATEKTSRNDPDTQSFTALGIEDNEVATRSAVELETPRKFIEVTIHFDAGDGIQAVENAVEKTNFSTPPQQKNPVAVLTLTGKNTGVTHNEIRNVADQLPVALVRLEDERVSTEFETVDVEVEQTAQGIDSAITDAISEKQLSQDVQEIEDLARDIDSVPKSRVRDEVDAIIDGDNNEA